MILVTVGTQLPFDRLIKAMDKWAKENPSKQVFAQVGVSRHVPKFIDFAPKVSQEKFKQLVSASQLIVAHAGMGSILMSLEYSKPIIIVPRLAEFAEHRNDHQLATVRKFSHLSQVHAAEPETLGRTINRIYERQSETTELSPYASPELLRRIQNFTESA